MARKGGAIALLVWTVVITVLRAARLPNDYSAAHWLLDYRYGFVKRGLVGTIVSLVSSVLHVPITAGLIAGASIVLFVGFCTLLVWLALRMIQRAQWSTPAILVALVFLSSPFVVMSAHLIGYYDNLVIMLAVASIVLLLRRRPWSAALVQVVAVCVHESTLVLGFPAFCVAWFVINRRRQPGSRAMSFAPLVVPLVLALLMVLGRNSLLNRDFREDFEAHIRTYAFIEGNVPRIVPEFLAERPSTTRAKQVNVEQRYTDPAFHGLIWPTVLTMLSFLVGAFVVAGPIEALGVLGVCFVPQLLHLVAWDTTRIWTYSIVTTFTMLWFYAEIAAARLERVESSLLSLLCVVVLCLNVVTLTPLMESQTDHFATLSQRLLLFAPVFAGAVWLTLLKADTTFPKAP